MKIIYGLGATVLLSLFGIAVYQSEKARILAMESQMSPMKESIQSRTEIPTQSPIPPKVNKSKMKFSPKYTVIDINRNDEIKFAMTVQIEQKYKNDLLETIANEAVESTGVKANSGVVFFLTPEIRLDNGAWAAVQFDTMPTTTILGLSIEGEHRLRLAAASIESFEGLWIDNTEQEEVIVRIRNDNQDRYFFEYISSTEYGPSQYASEVVKTLKNGTIHFVDAKNGEYFVVKDNGNLDVFDSDGYVLTYMRIK